MILVQAVADGRLGGGTTHVLQLIEAVRAALPVEVHLISQQNSPALAEGARLGATVHGMNFFRSRLDPVLWLQLRGMISALGPDLIHAHGARAALPMAVAAGAAPLIYSVHGFHFVGKAWPACWFASVAEKICMRRAAQVVFVCEHDRALADRAHLRGEDHRYEVIPNGIEIEDLPQATGSADGREIAFLGRLDPQKDPLLLVEVLERLPGHRLRVIGDGPLRDAMAARARAGGLAGRVVHLGSLPRAQALQQLAGCDILLLPSRWEGMPIAALEAMAVGVPVVASAVGGVTEVVEHGTTGLLVRERDAEGFAREIRRLGDDPALRERLRRQARAAVERCFNWGIARERYMRLYRSALAGEPLLEHRSRPY